jgi:hypothetical protein
MIDLAHKLAVQPDRANCRPILVARTVCHERFICDSYEVAGRLPAGSTAAEHIFPDGAFGCKTNVLQDDWIVHKEPLFLTKGSRELDLGASLQEGKERCRKGNKRSRSDDDILMVERIRASEKRSPFRPRV